MTVALSLLLGAPAGVAIGGGHAELAGALLAALLPEPGLRDGDVLVVPGALVSHAEGRVVDAVPGTAWREAVVAVEARRVLRRPTGPEGTTIAETRHGFVCADAGVIAGPGDTALLLPVDPDRSARRLRAALEARTGARLAVVVAGRFDDAWRRGRRPVALGCAGLAGVGPDGVAVTDDLAAAAAVALGACGADADTVTVVVRGVAPAWFGVGSVATDVVRPAGEQRFR